MASEDIFEEDYSEDIISELDNDHVGNVEEINGTEEAVGPSEETIKTLTNDSNVEIKSNLGALQPKMFQLPLTRVRNLMKLDPDLHIASNEAVFGVARATELFIESLAREAFFYTAQSKKKTIQKRDVDMAVTAIDSLIFLDGAMNF